MGETWTDVVETGHTHCLSIGRGAPCQSPRQVVLVFVVSKSVTAKENTGEGRTSRLLTVRE